MFKFEENRWLHLNRLFPTASAIQNRRFGHHVACLIATFFLACINLKYIEKATPFKLVRSLSPCYIQISSISLKNTVSISVAVFQANFKCLKISFDYW